MRHFTESEFSDFSKMKPELIARLDNARHEAGVPFKLTSTYRLDDKDKYKTHGRGYAADISCMKSRQRHHILRGLRAAGFTRIGIYNKHIHADCDPNEDQDVTWTGKSK